MDRPELTHHNVGRQQSKHPFIPPNTLRHLPPTIPRRPLILIITQKVEQNNTNKHIHPLPIHNPTNNRPSQHILLPTRIVRAQITCTRSLEFVHPLSHTSKSVVTRRGRGHHSTPPPYASTVPLAASASTVPLVQSPTDSALNIQTQAPPAPPPLHPPLLTLHDQTPVLTVRSLTGLFEIDRAEEKALGVDTSFCVAVGLTYLEFLEERESYLAALSD